MDEALKMVKMHMDEEHQEGERGTVKGKIKRRIKAFDFGSRTATKEKQGIGNKQ